jgi:hypothetical protein
LAGRYQRFEAVFHAGPINAQARCQPGDLCEAAARAMFSLECSLLRRRNGPMVQHEQNVRTERQFSVRTSLVVTELNLVRIIVESFDDRTHPPANEPMLWKVNEQGNHVENVDGRGIGHPRLSAVSPIDNAPSVFDAGEHVLAFHPVIPFDDRVDVVTCREHVQDMFDCEAMSTNARFATEDRRVDDDASEKVRLGHGLIG